MAKKGDERSQSKAPHFGAGRHVHVMLPTTAAEREMQKNAARDDEIIRRRSVGLAALGVETPKEAEEMMRGNISKMRTFLRAYRS